MPAVKPVSRIDAWFVDAFQQLYDAAWDRVGVPVGSFRMASALLPVTVDTGLELARGGDGQCLGGLLLYLVAIALLYSPVRMVRDDRVQAAGGLALLNAEARLWAHRTTRLRAVYLGLTAFSLLTFHHLGGLALVDVAYARCLQVRPRVPTRRRHVRMREAVVAGLGRPA